MEHGKDALELVKAAGTGRVKGDSTVKESPAWQAQNKLHGSVEYPSGNPRTSKRRQ
jgi:hypothetical protein